jgi:ribosome maturation protein Sdo1
MKRKKDQNSSKEAEKSQEKRGEADQDEVYQISSVYEDCSKGIQSINYLIWDIYLCAFDFS